MCRVCTRVDDIGEGGYFGEGVWSVLLVIVSHNPLHFTNLVAVALCG